MLLESNKVEESRWSRLWQFSKSYARHVGTVYLSFAAPIAIFCVFNMAVDMQDQERFGLAWLHYAGMEDEHERETKFPAYEPGSAPQRKRLAAASATEFVQATV